MWKVFFFCLCDCLLVVVVTIGPRVTIVVQEFDCTNQGLLNEDSILFPTPTKVKIALRLRMPYSDDMAK